MLPIRQSSQLQLLFFFLVSMVGHVCSLPGHQVKPFRLRKLNLAGKDVLPNKSEKPVRETPDTTPVTPQTFPPVDKIVDTFLDPSIFTNIFNNLDNERPGQRPGGSGSITKTKSEKFEAATIPTSLYSLILSRTRTYHDLFRRFYGSHLADKQIERRLFGKHRQIARSNRHHLKQKLRGISRHLNKVQQQMKVPQIPRLVVVDVKSESVSIMEDNAEYIPPQTLLHRCPQHCCPLGRRGACLPGSKTPVHLPFLVVQKTQDNQVLLDPSSKDLVVTLEFVNHTSCTCVEDANGPEDNGDDISKEDREACQCPKLFHERRDRRNQCTCECFVGEEDCLDIRNGFKSLDDASSRCVESGRCEPPTCTSGTFDLSTSLCPSDSFDQGFVLP